MRHHSQRRQPHKSSRRHLSSLLPRVQRTRSLQQKANQMVADRRPNSHLLWRKNRLLLMQQRHQLLKMPMMQLQQSNDRLITSLHTYIY